MWNFRRRERNILNSKKSDSLKLCFSRSSSEVKESRRSLSSFIASWTCRFRSFTVKRVLISSENESGNRRATFSVIIFIIFRKKTVSLNWFCGSDQLVLLLGTRKRFSWWCRVWQEQFWNWPLAVLSIDRTNQPFSVTRPFWHSQATSRDCHQPIWPFGVISTPLEALF